MPESLWTRVADLPLTVAAHTIERLEAPAPAERVTYLVRLRGGDAEGLGEDVGGDMLDPKGAFLAAAPSLELAGEWTLATFLDHVAGLDLWPEPPEWEAPGRLRRGSVECARGALAGGGVGVGRAVSGARGGGRRPGRGARPGAGAGAIRQLARARRPAG